MAWATQNLDNSAQNVVFSASDTQEVTDLYKYELK